MKWTNLAEWHRLDREVKAWLDRATDLRFKGVPPQSLNAWLTAQVCFAIAIPLLLTPLVTMLLYPWLPQPDRWLYGLTGVGLLCVSLGAYHEYKKRAHETPALSEHPTPPREKGMSRTLMGMTTTTPEATDGEPASTETVRIEIMLHGETYRHYVKTQIFLDSLIVNRRDERVTWHLDVVRLGMNRAQAVRILQHTLLMMSDEDKWAIIEPIAHELEENGHKFRSPD